ncbi:hypothetical protein M378DRAFT_17801 [Amanita muscaria Koide BX008]|uniref:Uncharacterized protein n=1 Tax=Amanita muscaria (strain Koide BX008) TaxID=946122 RepID=A0A0C2WHL3_AMAMK|nr:hypothetical protein M378DRAFT_17801 [Amanita muscaria Koide BX008]
MLAACRYIMASSVVCGDHTCGPLDVIKLSFNQVWSGEITSRHRCRRASTALETKRGRVSILRIIGFVTGVMLHTLEGASVMDAGLVRQPFGKYTHWTATALLVHSALWTHQLLIRIFFSLSVERLCPAIPGVLDYQKRTLVDAAVSAVSAASVVAVESLQVSPRSTAFAASGMDLSRTTTTVVGHQPSPVVGSPNAGSSSGSTSTAPSPSPGAGAAAGGAAIALE